MPDTFSVQDKHGSPFTQPQYEAARFMVARLRAEAAGEKFNPEDIGIKFTPLGDFPAATVDDGTVISTTDFIRASLLMVWSLVVDMADNCETTPGEVIRAVGLSLAEHDPA